MRKHVYFFSSGSEGFSLVYVVLSMLSQKWLKKWPAFLWHRSSRPAPSFFRGPPTSSQAGEKSFIIWALPGVLW